MATGVSNLPRVQIGGVSLVSAELANPLIDAVNDIRNATVAPIANVGSFKVSKGAFILDLTSLDGRVRALEGANSAILNAVYNTNGTLNSNVLVSAANIYANVRLVTTNANAAPSWYLDFSALHNTLTAINARLTNLIASINNANISANCNANSNAITVTLTFPNVPGV